MKDYLHHAEVKVVFLCKTTNPAGGDAGSTVMVSASGIGMEAGRQPRLDGPMGGQEETPSLTRDHIGNACTLAQSVGAERRHVLHRAWPRPVRLQLFRGQRARIIRAPCVPRRLLKAEICGPKTGPETLKQCRESCKPGKRPEGSERGLQNPSRQSGAGGFGQH